jgi:hypothetical protein
VGGALGAVAHPVSKSGSTSIDLTDLTVFLLAKLIGGRLQLLFFLARGRLRLGVLLGQSGVLSVPSLLNLGLAPLMPFPAAKPGAAGKRHKHRNNRV